MVKEKLYLPKELEPVLFGRENESWIRGSQLLERVSELGIISGNKQFFAIWDKKYAQGHRIPDDWKSFWGVVIPVLYPEYIIWLSWNSINDSWDYMVHNPDIKLNCAFYRALRPRDGA